MPDVFVSYASNDRERVRPIVAAIEAVGWSVWWDRNIDAGTAFDREIERALDNASCVVVIWTEDAVESEWVRNEASDALERLILVPALLDDVKLPLAFRRQQTLSLKETPGDYSALLAAIAKLVAVPEARARFVGRSAEQAFVADRFGPARNGSGSFLLLSGEAGVGKTRLACEAVAAAQNLGFNCFTGHCLDSPGAPPYQPLIEQIDAGTRRVSVDALRAVLGENAPEVATLMPELRQLLPDIPKAVQLPPEQERRYLLHGVIEFLDRAANMQPMVLVFEDLHWADESTCLFLRYLAPRLAEIPMVVIGTYRDTELDPDMPFTATLRELIRGRFVQEVHLPRLTREHVSQLLESLARRHPPDQLIDRVYLETEGNPFFVEELLRHLRESGRLFDDAGEFRRDADVAETEVPRGIRLVISHRLARVTKDCRRVLGAAAVAGRTFDFELAIRSVGLDEDAVLAAIEEAAASTLIEEVTDTREARYRFVHEQTRQTVLSELSVPRRQRLHFAVANALQQLRKGEARYAGEIANHLYQSGSIAPRDITLEFLTRAADYALDALAFEDALANLDLILELADGDALEENADTLMKRARALRGAGAIDDTLAALARALEGSISQDTRDVILQTRARLLVDIYRGKEAVPDAQRLLRHAIERGDDDKRLDAQQLLSEAHYVISLDHAESAQQARESCESTIALARELGRKKALALALISSAHLSDYWREYWRIGAVNLEEASQIADELDDEELRIKVTTARMRLDVFGPAELADEADAIMERLRRRRDPVMLNEHYFWMMWHKWNTGQFEQCVEFCDKGIDLARRLGLEPVQYPSIRALALMDMGRFDEAWTSLQDEVTDEDHRFGRAMQTLAVMVYELDLFADARALETAESLIPEVIALSRNWMARWIIDVLTLVDVRSPDEAASRLLASLAGSSGFGPRLASRAGETYLRGDYQAAGKIAADAARRLEERGQHREQVMAQETLVAALSKQHSWTEAIDEATGALERARALNFKRMAWRIQARRGFAYQVLADHALADQDLAEARDVLEGMAATVSDEALRASLWHEGLASRLRNATPEWQATQ